MSEKFTSDRGNGASSKKLWGKEEEKTISSQINEKPKKQKLEGGQSNYPTGMEREDSLLHQLIG